MTKEQLEAENAALYDIFAAVNEAEAGGVSSYWLIGYVQGIGSGRDLATLRAYAADIRAKDAEDEEDARFAAEAAGLDELEPLPAALARIHVHLFGQDGICAQCDLDIVTWSAAQGDAELDHIAIEGTRS